MSNPWFRMYSEFATDPKVQMLSESDQRRFVMLLCLRCSNADVTLQDEEVAFQLRISNEQWGTTKALLVGKGLLLEDNTPAAWDKRQYVSDSSAARVAAHRQRKKQACNVTVTPPDTDTDTDTDITPPIPPKGAAKSKKPKFDPLAARPENVSPQTWADWCRHRAEIKKTLTETTCQHQAKQLAGHPAPDAVINQSIANSWTGLFPEKVTHASSQHTGRKGALSAVDQVRLAIAERQAQSEQHGQAVAEDGGTLRDPLDGEFRRVG